VCRIRLRLCRTRDYGRVFLDHYDDPFQSPRPCARLAERRHQMVNDPANQNPRTAAVSETSRSNVLSPNAPFPNVESANEGATLRVTSITKNFPAPDHPEVRVLALQDISLSLAAGELVSVLGPSGCGKSTLLRLIAGLDRPNSGELSIGDQRIASPSA